MNAGRFSPALNGVYRAPKETGALRATVRDAGLHWGVVHLQRARGKRALLNACARGLAFPETFGGNWDALADSLQDLSWLQEPGWVVVLRGAADFAAAAPDEYAQLLEILGTAAAYWRGHGRLFVVLSEGTGGLPSFPAP